VLILGVAGCANRVVPGPRGFWRSNRFDRQGNPQGLWKVYFDSAKVKPFTKGHYRHGQAVRRWRYYSPLGGLERQERYHRQGLSTLTYYYPNGRVARRGRARVVSESDGLHFYWFGEWRNYADTGSLQKVETYTKGKLTATRPVKP